MPCHDPGAVAGYAIAAEREFMVEKLNERTAMLCEAMTILERLKSGGMINGYSCSVELQRWWEEHKAYDEARRER
jgi:hypothetical protein